MSKFYIRKGVVIEPDSTVLIKRTKGSIIFTKRYSGHEKAYSDSGFVKLPEEEWAEHGIKEATEKDLQKAGFELQEVSAPKPQKKSNNNNQNNSNNSGSNNSNETGANS